MLNPLKMMLRFCNLPVAVTQETASSKDFDSIAKDSTLYYSIVGMVD